MKHLAARIVSAVWGEAFGVARQARKVTDEAWEVISGIPESIPIFTDWRLRLG